MAESPYGPQLPLAADVTQALPVPGLPVVGDGDGLLLGDGSAAGLVAALVGDGDLLALGPVLVAGDLVLVGDLVWEGDLLGEGDLLAVALTPTCVGDADLPMVASSGLAARASTFPEPTAAPQPASEAVATTANEMAPHPRRPGRAR